MCRQSEPLNQILLKLFYSFGKCSFLHWMFPQWPPSLPRKKLVYCGKSDERIFDFINLLWLTLIKLYSYVCIYFYCVDLLYLAAPGLQRLFMMSYIHLLLFLGGAGIWVSVFFSRKVWLPRQNHTAAGFITSPFFSIWCFLVSKALFLT